MTSFLKRALAIVALALLPTAANAALVVNAVQSPAGNIAPGATATFDIFVKTDAGTQAFGFLGFDIVLGTPGAGGSFVPGSGTSLLGGIGWLDITADKGLFDAQSNAGIPSFGTSPTKIASINLSTAGATGGTYEIRFENLIGLTSAFGDIPIGGETTSYTISAVPEPSSIALASIVCVGGMVARFRRRKVAA